MNDGCIVHLIIIIQGNKQQQERAVNGSVITIWSCKPTWRRPHLSGEVREYTLAVWSSETDTSVLPSLNERKTEIRN